MSFRFMYGYFSSTATIYSVWVGSRVACRAHPAFARLLVAGRGGCPAPRLPGAAQGSPELAATKVSVVVCCICVQFLAMLWYGLSFIPYGRKILGRMASWLFGL